MAIYWGKCDAGEGGGLLRFGDQLGLASGSPERTLLWTRETSPELIEAVALFIAKRGLFVTDLELSWSFMEDDGQLMRWLVGLANRTKVLTYWIRGEGLDEERQRRVRALLLREIQLQHDPFSESLGRPTGGGEGKFRRLCTMVGQLSWSKLGR